MQSTAAPLVRWALLSAALLLFQSRAQCPNMCNGHGRCIEINRCECFSSWDGGDCSLRKCPFGRAWADVAVDDDRAHEPAECSNRGVCNHKTGDCACYPGYEGLACSRMICPADCSTHGECHSMRHHAATIDKGVLRVPLQYTNVRAPYSYRFNWDADLIHGCTCDGGFGGWDCTNRVCPKGDDPMTMGQADEVQLIRCDMDPADPLYRGAQFTLSFRGAVTRPFAADTAPADLRALLEELPTLRRVSVAYLGGTTTFCDATFGGAGSNPTSQPASGGVVAVTFLTEHGDVPRLVVLDQTGKPLYGSKDNLVYTASDGDSMLYTTALVPNVATATALSVTGTKEDLPCAGRGKCNDGTGVCSCYTGYTASDGFGRAGDLADCGYAYLPITSCPGVGVECSGHGTCSGFPSYGCDCYEGWTDGDCSVRTCPQGPAWFDYPTDNDVAHALAECSNKGSCDRKTGLCVCQSLFEGSACERMTCPGKTSPLGVCSGHGRCLAMTSLAEFARDNGDPTPHTYGANPNNPATWDAHMVAGCMCDEGYTGYECSQRTCPTGNDITLLEADPVRKDEQQELACQLLSSVGAPTFVLTFRGSATRPLRYDASAAEVKDALEALPTIGRVDVTYSTSLGPNPPGPDNFCVAGPTPQRTVFQFRTEHGDLPPLQVALDDATRDPVSGEWGHGLGWTDVQLEFTGGDPATSFATDFVYQKASPAGTYPRTGIRAKEAYKGKSTEAECSGRGICDRESGQCKCFLGFGSSNGDRAPGAVENCGWREPYVPVQ